MEGDPSTRQAAPVPVVTRATGWRLFGKQFKALFWKNVLLSWRNYRATALQLLSSFFFIFLIYIVAKAIDAQNKGKTAFKSVRNPEPFLIPGLPACETGYYIKQPCYDFVYAPDNLSSVNSIVQSMRAQNPGRTIPPEKVRAFPSAAAIDAWLLANPSRCPAAVVFQETALGLGYGIQTNSTIKSQRGQFEDPNFKFQVPLQQAVEREIVRFVTGEASLNWYTWLVEFAHPATETFSAAGAVGPTFLFAAAMFGFVIQIGAVVGERELKLRQAMDTMGLRVSVFWLTWIAWEVVLVFLSSLLIVIFGLMFQFDLFKKNGFFVLFVLFFLFELAMAGLAFLASTFLQTSAPATTLGFFIFILGFIVQLVTVFGFPYADNFAPWIRYLWSLFPPNLLAIGLSYLGDATASKDDHGISWGQITSHCGDGGINEDCVFPLSNCFKYLLVEFLVYTALATYLDRVFPDVNGVRRPWLFFLYPSYWTGGSGGLTGGNACCSCTSRGADLPPHSGPEDEDVVAERELVEAQANQAGGPPPGVAVQLRNLRKSFAGTRSCSCKYCCCFCTSTPPFHAVKGVSFTIEENKLFCLLGPNGAGKTTTINMLTGVLPATSGSALVYGNNIVDAGGMGRVRSFMGVCPQFDILWGDLTGREHLWLFANIRGLPRQQVATEVEDLLAQVRLVESGNVRSSSYSGGMKRRLSVAIALIGDPKVVYLDEPTTGMDPISRRHVWDIIEHCKQGRAFILTTHSMEEADILGDRIAIMAKGRMRCIGSSIHLKNKFGAGYIVNVSVRSSGGSYTDLPTGGAMEHDAHKAEGVKAFFKQGLGVDPVEESKAYIRFLVPRSQERVLPEFFAVLQQRRAELGVTDVQLSLSTLEEVFLTIARQAELETAQAEGRYEKIRLEDGTEVQVPVGAPFVALPGSASPQYPNGLMVEVTWQQDDAGRLLISHHSEPMPAPAPAARFTQQDSGLGRARRSLSKNNSNIGQALTEIELAGSSSLPSTVEPAPPLGPLMR